MTEEEMRLVEPNYKNLIDAFNTQVISKDVMREIWLKMPRKQRNGFQIELIIAATVVKVLSNEFLANCITLIEEGLSTSSKEQLEKLDALRKFKERYQYQQTDQYKKLHEVKNE